jgi:gliding motility-associated-like protein
MNVAFTGGLFGTPGIRRSNYFGPPNIAPSNITLSNATIDENNAVGASIGTLASTDPDAGDSFTYSLVSGAGSTDNSKFTLSGNTLKAAEAFDFETKSSYSIRIQTTDAGGLSFQKTLSISITDVNETPSAMAITKSNLYESNTINQVVGALSTSDQDAGDSHTYSLVSGVGSTDNAAFNVSGNQIRASQVFSFSTKNSYSIRVRTTDKGGLSFEKVYTVSISQLPTLTGTGNEFGTQAPTAASTSPKISKGYKSNLQVSGNNLVSYSWSPSKGLSSTSIANPVAEITETATYSVLVTNSFGSSVTLNITIEVMEDWNITANNILTPNGDGQNDKWEIENLSSYPNNELVILDRSNRVIFRKTGYANDWNGLFNGAPLPPDTYYFILTFDSASGKKASKKGFITIPK